LLVAVLDGKADMNRFTPEMQKELEKSNDRVAAFVKTQGAIQSFNLFERAEAPTGTQYRYQVVFSGMSLFLAITVDKNGKISGFALQPE